VIPLLADAGLRVIVPYLRGFGPTQFTDPDTPRSGQQAALGADVVALMDALGIDRAILAGYDWGGRGACVAAALWPECCAGLVSVNEGPSHPSPSRPSPWTARRADPISRPPTAPRRRTTSPAPAPIVRSPARGITCPRKPPRRSPKRSLI